MASAPSAATAWSPCSWCWWRLPWRESRSATGGTSHGDDDPTQAQARMEGVGRAVRTAPAAGLRRAGRGGRLRGRLDQRPLPAVASHRRALALLDRLAGGDRGANEAPDAGHERPDPDVP